MFFNEYPKSSLFDGSISSFVWWDNSAQPRGRERIDRKMKRPPNKQCSILSDRH